MPLAVFAVVFTLYAWTAAPGTLWLDAAELTTAAVTLGIAHPPGHPIPSLVGKLLSLLPFGDLAWRVNLASAAAAALASAALSMAASRAALRVAPKLGARLANRVGAAAALAFALTRAAWDQAVRAEVYAVESLLVCVALAALVAWDEERDARALGVAAFAIGLALANHHFVTLLFVMPAVLFALARRRPPSVAACGRAAALMALGLAAFAYLPLRAARDVIGWGDPDRWGSFVWTVSAQAFQKALATAQPPIGERAADLGTALAGDIGLGGAALVLAGLWALARARTTWSLLLLLAGVVGLAAVGRAAIGFDTDNPDAFGYLLPAFAALCVLGAAGVALVARAVPRAAIAVALLSLAWPVAQLMRGIDDASLRGASAAERHAHVLLDGLPPHAVLLVSYFETAFRVQLLQELYGERPDVQVIDRGLLTHPFAPAAAVRRRPELAALLRLHLGGGVLPDVRVFGGRPVLVELAANLAPDFRLAPWGGLAWLAPAPLTPDERALAEQADARRTAELEAATVTTAPLDRHGADRALAWSSYLSARLYCAIGRFAAGRAALARAGVRAAATDELIAEGKRACGE